LLGAIDHVVPADHQIHLIADNYATHKHPKVKSWLRRHPRFHMHFTPTSCSWLNMVRTTRQKMRHGNLPAASSSVPYPGPARIRRVIRRQRQGILRNE
jgi:hypothetical protein